MRPYELSIVVEVRGCESHTTMMLLTPCAKSQKLAKVLLTCKLKSAVSVATCCVNLLSSWVNANENHEVLCSAWRLARLRSELTTLQWQTWQNGLAQRWNILVTVAMATRRENPLERINETHASQKRQAPGAKQSQQTPPWRSRQGGDSRQITSKITGW